MLDSRYSDNEVARRDIPSFIEPRPPLISNPFMRPRPQKGINLLELFEEDSECEEPELVQVYLRLKPCNNPSNLYEVRSDRHLITSLDTTTAGHGRRTQHNVSKMFTFSHIFGPETDQGKIFETVVKENLKKLPEGNSFTLLTYGASGSGKTFTLMGTVASPGLVPRSLEYVFKVVNAAQTPLYKPSECGTDKLSSDNQEHELQWVKRLQVAAPLKDKYRRMSMQLRNNLTTSSFDLSNRSRHYVWVSFIEIYNEGIYDLLAPGDRRNAQKLAIREDSSGNVYVKGAKQIFVRSGEEAYEVMVAGKHNLQVAATGVHSQSSRSHCIFTITMLNEQGGAVSSSAVRLCDLAGCERAVRTRNTGARMCESRAINSSLHVLERCLRALRRKGLRGQTRRPVVPYRESKLTRLLGSGLSGARGEAVSMVVTLNPSPDYANETRHVLQLAAVAKDIQINNTISEYPSSLEDISTQDTTVEFNIEIIKLRADNERLRFELAQAHSRNKELLASMEQKQAAGAETIKELVSEAKEITANYYEDQLRALKDKMAEMAEEYESRLDAAEVRKPETPLRNKDAKINQLVTDIAILEENLQAERLARARAEEEVQHLRACIEERDEKSDEELSVDNVSLTDSESEEDPINESLEPTFKKEDINRSRLLRQSTVQAETSVSDNSLNKTTDTLKDDSREYETSEDVTGTEYDCSLRDSFGPETKICTVKKANIRGTYFVEENINQVQMKLSRETYCVSDKEILNEDQPKSEEDRVCNNDDGSAIDNGNEKYENNTISQEKKPDTFVNKIINSIKESSILDSNNSLAQFERLELEMKECNVEVNETEVFSDIKILKEKRNFFEEGSVSPVTKEKKIFFDNLNKEKKSVVDVIKTKIDDRSPSIVREDVDHAVEFTPSMIKKLLEKSKRQAKNMGAINQVTIYPKKHDSIDLFDESPRVLSKTDYNVETVCKSVADIVLSNKIEATEETTDEIVINRNEKTVQNVPNVERNAQEKDNISFDVRKSVEIENTHSENKHSEEEIKIFKRDQSEEDKENKVNLPLIKIQDMELESDGLITKLSTNNKSYTDQIKTEVIKSETDENFDKFNICDIRTIDLNVTNIKINNSQTDVGNVNNTLDEFDNIYKDVTVPRATEFELLVSQEIRESTVEANKSNKNEQFEEVKYNLRHKKSEKPKVDTKKDKERPIRRNLRLRRRKNQSEDDDSETKLKDIGNLQVEFSDVTMDVPAPIKCTEDIPSPEKIDENHPPILTAQSCPAKGLTRSRRKLFTPRAEPVDETVNSDKNSNERVVVPRPSYHPPRARRKL